MVVAEEARHGLTAGWQHHSPEMVNRRWRGSEDRPGQTTINGCAERIPLQQRVQTLERRLEMTRRCRDQRATLAQLSSAAWWPRIPNRAERRRPRPSPNAGSSSLGSARLATAVVTGGAIFRRALLGLHLFHLGGVSRQLRLLLGRRRRRNRGAAATGGREGEGNRKRECQESHFRKNLSFNNRGNSRRHMFTRSCQVVSGALAAAFGRSEPRRTVVWSHSSASRLRRLPPQPAATG